MEKFFFVGVVVGLKNFDFVTASRGKVKWNSHRSHLKQLHMPLTATDDEIKSLCVRSNVYCVHENSFSSCVSAPSAKRETFIISPIQQRFEPRVKPESTLVKSFWNVRSSQRNSIQKPFYDVIMCGGGELRAMQMRTKIQFVLEKIKNFPL